MLVVGFIDHDSRRQRLVSHHLLSRAVNSLVSTVFRHPTTGLHAVQRNRCAYHKLKSLSSIVYLSDPMKIIPRSESLSWRPGCMLPPPPFDKWSASKKNLPTSKVDRLSDRPSDYQGRAEPASPPRRHDLTSADVLLASYAEANLVAF